MYRSRRAFAIAVLTAFSAIAFTLAQPVASAPRQTDNQGAASEWPSYFGNEKGWSHSQLREIQRNNVSRLVPAWSFSTGKNGLYATPVVVGTTLYLLTPTNDVFALDAATGRQIWAYKGQTPDGFVVRGSLGLTAHSGLLFIAMTDHTLAALDMKTGREVWRVQIEDPAQCGCNSGAAPLVAGDKVLIGTTSESGHRGYIDAFDTKSGRHVWRFWTIPAPGEPGHETWPEEIWRLGSTSTWYVGTYDPELKRVYWGIGNPGPMLGGEYGGAKLYSESLVALDVETGKVIWHYQEIPADKFDYDAVMEPVLIDLPVNGAPRKLVIHVNKGGFAYVLDRVTGQFVRGFPYADTINWTKGLDANGQPLEPRLQLKVGEPTLVCPGAFGARAAGHSAFNPQTGLWFNSSYEICTTETALPSALPREGQGFNAASFEKTHVPAGTRPFVGAFDPVSGRKVWSSPTNSVNVSALLSTAGGLVFGGDVFGNAWALDDRDGRKLWSFNIGTGISGGPMTYAVNGRQFLAVTGGLSFGGQLLSKEVLSPEEQKMLPPTGSVLFIFAIPKP